MTAIKIETITSVQQLEQYLDIYIVAYTGEPWNDKWTYNTAKAMFNNCFNTPGFMGWLAIANNEVVGACIGNTEPYYAGNNYILRELFVSVQWQGKGIGNMLLSTAKQELANTDVKTILLFTQRAIFDFYTGAGFTYMKEMGIMSYAVSGLNNTLTT